MSKNKYRTQNVKSVNQEKLAEMVQDKDIILTRSTDEFISLEFRIVNVISKLVENELKDFPIFLFYARMPE